MNEIEIKKDWPPNIEEIRKVFTGDFKNVVFTHGDTIYNPEGLPISQDLYVHESIHATQQRLHEGGPKEWWKKYLESPEFRLEQELQAYSAQYRVIKATSTAKYTKSFLHRITDDLSSDLYGKIVTYPKAESLIRHRAK